MCNLMTNDGEKGIEPQKDQNKKPCINCRKLMPLGNPVCYSCGTNQKTGEVDKAFNLKLKKQIFGVLSYGGPVTREGLRCVRCESTEDLEYYKMTKAFEKKEVGAPFTNVYKSKPSFNFPVCPNCAENFTKWKKLRLIFIVVAALWIFLSYLIFNALSINVFSTDLFIRIIYFSIALIIVFISYIVLIKHRNNPNKWMSISGYFDINHNFRYQGKVHLPNSKEWINYDQWVEEIKRI